MAGILEPYRQAHLETVFPRLAGSRREFLRAERIEGDRMLGQLIEVPVGRSTMIAAEIDCAANPDYFLKLDYDLFSASGVLIGQLSEHVGLIGDKVRALTMIPPGVRWIQAHTSVPGSVASVVPDMIVLSLVTTEKPIAVGMGGVMCDGSPTGLALAMRNISQNFDAYTADARRLAAEVGSAFTPERLVEMLAGPAASGGTAIRSAPRAVAATQRPSATVTPIAQAAREPLKASGRA